MGYNPEIHRRRSLRLKGYDYTHMGAYFITIVTQGRLCLFGEIVGQEIQLNAAGEMVCKTWEMLPQRFPTIEIDMFVVMPNHLHGIIVINQLNRATTRVAPTNQNPDRGAENAPNTPNRISTTVAPTKLTNVGARNTNNTEHRATTRVAPTKLTNVGAGLVPAQTPTGEVKNATTVLNRATTRVAPTKSTNVGAGLVPAQNIDGETENMVITLGDVIGAYKSLTTVEYVQGVKTMKWGPFRGRLWQRNYYEHIVRHDESLRDLQ